MFNFFIISWCFIAAVFKASLGVEVHPVEFPPPIEFGSQNEVVLSCNYDISEEEQGQLDLKWYFNDEVTPFLQWIPGDGRRPQLIGATHFLANHLDLDFKLEDENEHKAYRALKIVDPKLTMAGNYRCKVSTFEDEGYVEQKLSIYVPPKAVKLEHQFDPIGSLNVTCIIEQVFPEPQVKLLWNESELPSEFYYMESGEAVSSNTEGLLDVKLFYNVENLAETAASVNFGCALTFPPPLQMSYSESLIISLEMYEEGSGSGECLFCDDSSSGSGSGDPEYFEEAENGTLDYDNDWLNVYNESESACDTNCDTLNSSTTQILDDSIEGETLEENGSTCHQHVSIGILVTLLAVAAFG